MDHGNKTVNVREGVERGDARLGWGLSRPEGSGFSANEHE